MIDFLQLQNDLYAATLASERLATVNVAQEIQMLMQSEIDVSSIWMTPRNGRSGVGIYVERPRLEITQPNLPGPQVDLSISLSVIEQRDINATPGTGTQLQCEQIGMILLDELHTLRLAGSIGFQLSASACSPALVPKIEDVDTEGVVACRVTFKTKLPRFQTVRVSDPILTIAGGNATLVSPLQGAALYYTIDAGLPAVDAATAVPIGATQTYAAPFAVNAGQLVRCRAYKAGCTGSNVVTQQA